MLEALLNRVIVKPDPIEEISKGGIVIAQTDSYVRQEKSSRSTGVIVGIGPSAWLDPLLGGEPCCSIGDRIVYAKYSGKFIIDPDDGEEYSVINDDAVQARIEKCQKP